MNLPYRAGKAIKKSQSDRLLGCRIRSKDTSGFDEAIRVAEQADAVILVLGGSSTKYGSAEVRSETGAAVVSEILNFNECDKESGEGTDRATLCLSGVQMELFHALRKTGKDVIVVLIQGRPLLVRDFLDSASALLCGWYPGMFGGTAVAEVLFGEYNPAGRLPISIPRSEGQLPVYYNTHYSRDNWNYIDMKGAPELPFGFGLSYTTFEYKNISVNGRIVSVEVTNTGKCAGEEVVQFYLTALRSPVCRPCLELCGFERIKFAPGEMKTVQTLLTDELLGVYTRTHTFEGYSGPFRLSAGGSSAKLVSIVANL